MARTVLSAKSQQNREGRPAPAFAFGREPGSSSKHLLRESPELRLDFQVDQLGMNLLHVDEQLSDAQRQLKPARARAAWVEVEDAILLFDLRLMTVAVHDNSDSSGFGF